MSEIRDGRKTCPDCGLHWARHDEFRDRCQPSPDGFKWSDPWHFEQRIAQAEADLKRREPIHAAEREVIRTAREVAGWWKNGAPPPHRCCYDRGGFHADDCEMFLLRAAVSALEAVERAESKGGEG